jgi:hypothetical protein
MSPGSSAKSVSVSSSMTGFRKKTEYFTLLSEQEGIDRDAVVSHNAHRFFKSNIISHVKSIGWFTVLCTVSRILHNCKYCIGFPDDAVTSVVSSNRIGGISFVG